MPSNAELEVEKSKIRGTMEKDNILLKHKCIQDDEETTHKHIMEELEYMAKHKITQYNRGTK